MKKNSEMIKISYRSKFQNDSVYIPIEQSFLEVITSLKAGDGSSSNPYLYDIEIKNPGNELWEGIIHIEVKINQINTRFFMPAFLYGRNRGEVNRLPNSKLYPRLREGAVDIPYSPYWMVRADRLSHPVSMMYTEGRILGISGSPFLILKTDKTEIWSPDNQEKFSRFNGFSCSLENGSSIGYTLGYENAPVNYIDGIVLKERDFRTRNCIRIGQNEKLSFPVYLYDFDSKDERDISKVIADVYNRYHQEPRLGVNAKEAAEDISTAIYEDSYMEEIRNYATMVSVEENRVKKLPHTSISWTGGVEIATPLLMAALRLGREDMRSQALECIQNIVDNSINNQSGLPFDAFMDGKWTTEGWWGERLTQRGHSSYLVGQAIYYILKGYNYEAEIKGIQHLDWLNFAERVMERIVQTTNQEGEYPHIWSEVNGEGIEYDSFSGCWCLASLAYLARIKKDASLLSLCKKGEFHYYNKYVKLMECYGTPHDTYKAVDSEGILSYIKLVRILHEETGDEKYLEHLRNGLEYEFSFKFCYNVPIQTPPLSKIGWSSSGGSVTSTANHHIHPMSNSVVDEILYYFQKTGDFYFHQRLKDTIAWGLQSHNTQDGEYDFGKKGWMSERFCYSEGFLMEQYPDGSPSSTWFYFLPWGASNILEGLCGDIWALNDSTI